MVSGFLRHPAFFVSSSGGRVHSRSRPEGRKYGHDERSFRDSNPFFRSIILAAAFRSSVRHSQSEGKSCRRQVRIRCDFRTNIFFVIIRLEVGNQKMSNIEKWKQKKAAGRPKRQLPPPHCHENTMLSLDTSGFVTAVIKRSLKVGIFKGVC